MTDLKKAITGPHAREIKRLFEYAQTYKKMKDKLDQHFNNFEVCLPTQLKILEKLKVYPRYQSHEETNNIQAMEEQGKKKKTPPSSFTHHIGTKTPAKERPTQKSSA